MRLLALCATLVAALLAVPSIASATFVVHATAATAVASTGATLNGRGTCERSRRCFARFRWRRVGTSSWTETTNRLVCRSGPCRWRVTALVSGLTAGAPYQYQLTAEEIHRARASHGPAVATASPTTSFTTKVGRPAPSHLTERAPSPGPPSSHPVPLSPPSSPPPSPSPSPPSPSPSPPSPAPPSPAPPSPAPPSPGPPSPGPLTFNGNFDGATWSPWSPGGGPQCANTGTSSKSPRLRGDIYRETSVIGQGSDAIEIDLPADPSPSTYPLEACGIITPTYPLQLGVDSYYGMMFYIPPGWTIANNDFTGVNMLEYHFQNIWAAPIIFQLHPNYVTLALETGGCNNHTTSNPGCQYRSNAGHTPCTSTSSYRCLPPYYAIPVGGVVQGQWNEIVMHVHWAADGTGAIQTYYKVKGASTWSSGSAVSGIPTVQWDNAKGAPGGGYDDQLEAYTGALSAPLSLWLDNEVAGPSLGAVQAAMP